jgi:hypothetical protein
VNATHEELDRLADEFLLQQGRKRERRKFI